MNIKDLQARQTDVDIEAEVVEVGEPRTFSKMGKQGKVATAKIKDSTGIVKLSLWNEQAEQVKPGDRVRIQKGYVSEWQGELQLTTGKFGTLEVVGEERPAEPPKVLKEETKPAPVSEPATRPTAPAEEPKKEAPAEQPELDVEEEEVL